MTDSQRDSRRATRCRQLKTIIARVPEPRRHRLLRLLVDLDLRRHC